MTAPTSSDQRRAFIIGGVGLGLVAVLFVGSRLASGGGGDDAGDEPLAVPTTLPATGDDEPLDIEGALPPIPELPDTFEIVELRDPFESPLLNAVAASATDEPGPPDDGGTDGDGTTPTTEPDPTQPGVDGDPGGDVDLVAVNAGPPATVVVAVDGSQFGPLEEGDVFGPDQEFVVLAIDPGSRCALLRRGDETFTECVDEAVPNK